MKPEDPASPLEVVGAEAPVEIVSALRDELALSGFDPVVWIEDRSSQATLSLYLDSAREADRAAEALEALCMILDASDVRPFRHRLEREDWAESWKLFFHAQRVSERIVVKPSWESVVAQSADCIVEIDPGLSFGTGLHGTTRACLRFLDAWQRRQPQASVLDMGCGTGILAIAAAKLGFPRVSAMDNDPVAVRVARANAACNEMADRIKCIQADAVELKADMTYDLVMANLLAGMLVAWSDRITAVVSPVAGSGLVLSGILEEQYEAVRSVYVARGFEEQESLILEGWKTGCFRRR